MLNEPFVSPFSDTVNGEMSSFERGKPDFSRFIKPKRGTLGLEGLCGDYCVRLRMVYFFSGWKEWKTFYIMGDYLIMCLDWF